LTDWSPSGSTLPENNAIASKHIMQRQKSSENIQYLEAFFIFNNVYIAFIWVKNGYKPNFLQR